MGLNSACCWATQIDILRTPSGGIQPQALVGNNGTIHLIYFNGEAGAGDLFYTQSKGNDLTWFKSRQINQSPGAAMAIGSVRGAQLALGRDDWIHVAWMGSAKANRAIVNGQEQAPMLYTRFKPKSDKFESERNLLGTAGGLDGGGSLASDSSGRVAVVWHGHIGEAKGEQSRAVFATESLDDGSQFSVEKRISPEGTGACGCCGIKTSYADGGILQVVFRGAAQMTNRAELILSGIFDRGNFKVVNSAPWTINNCPMSTAALTQGKSTSFAAWETEGQVYWKQLQGIGDYSGKIMEPNNPNKRRKHPAIATNMRGEVLLAWTEGTGWLRGGRVAWQLYDKTGKPLQAIERRDGVPVWGLVTVVAKSNDNFALIY